MLALAGRPEGKKQKEEIKVSTSRFTVSAEQWKRLEEGLKIFGLGYYPFGYGYYIHIVTHNQQVGEIVGRLEDSRREGENYWLEIYDDKLSEDIKKKIGLILERCGLGGKT